MTARRVENAPAERSAVVPARQKPRAAGMQTASVEATANAAAAVSAETAASAPSRS